MTKKTKARLLLAGLSFCVLVAGVAFAWNRSSQPEELSVFAMGSYVKQTVWGGQQSAQTAAAQITQLENLISWRRESGDVFRLNQRAGKGPVELSPGSREVLERALELCEKSGGALDITLGPVTRLWDFDNEPHLPNAEELKEALAQVDYRNLLTGAEACRARFHGEVSENSGALVNSGMLVDLGALGKGAACDVAIAAYQETGARRAVVAVGGSVGLYGKKSQPWQVAVRDPRGQGSLGILALEGGFVSTSGSYEKFFEEEGRTYCHLLDPRTGYPAESGLVSVTVWHPESGLLSDGLATACFVLGLEDSLPLLESFHAEGIFVDEAGSFFVSPGLAHRFHLSPDSGYRQQDWPKGG